MTYLDTDKQTNADLTITGGPYDERSLCSLYTKTETKKGKLLMIEWLMYPLSDLDVIRKRQAAIAYHSLPELPLTEEELDFIEYYLDYRDQIRKVNPIFTLAAQIDRLFKYDSRRYIIRRGVYLIIRMLHQLEKLAKLIPESAPLLLKEFSRTIHETISGTELKKIMGQEPDNDASLSSYLVDKYDYLLRCTQLMTVKELLGIIYQLDVCRTAHAIAQKKNFCCSPEMVDTMDISVSGFVHPFIKNASSNDWKMSQGNICIFTGSNMAGKSTTLKALTVAVWLAHCGLPVPAHSMVCPVYEGIYTSINLPDSLRDGRSHFMAEVLRIKEVLQKARQGNRCLVVLDEMFRGTNAQDAFEASVAVNELLKKFPNCHFLVSTHIIEYAKAFENDNQCCFYYMESEIKDDHFICSYQIKEGISESKVGYWIVKKELNI